MMDRIKYIDGVRGLAILMVIGYHLFYRWSSILPYKNYFSMYFPFKHGWLGVQLFFLISGFVILMTLEKCKNGFQFIIKRWLRLFPAMLICSILIYFSSSFFNERPMGNPTWTNLLPGLTFVEPKLWSLLLGSKVNSLEGSFWSIYVEFKFYVISALVYKKSNYKYVIIIFSIYLISMVGILINFFLQNKYLDLVNSAGHYMSLRYFGWFSAGAAYYMYYKEKKIQTLLFGFVMSLVCSCLVKFDANVIKLKDGFVLEDTCYAIIISIIFYKANTSCFFKKVLSNNFILFIGFISYPLYLIHENLSIALIMKLSTIGFRLPNLVVILIVFLATVVISYVICEFLEKELRFYIKKYISKYCSC